MQADKEEETSNTEILAGIIITESESFERDDLSVLAANDDKEFRVITWYIIKSETQAVESLCHLSILVSSSFQDNKSEMPAELLPYWSVRNS